MKSRGVEAVEEGFRNVPFDVWRGVLDSFKLDKGIVADANTTVLLTRIDFFSGESFGDNTTHLFGFGSKTDLFGVLVTVDVDTSGDARRIVAGKVFVFAILFFVGEAGLIEVGFGKASGTSKLDSEPVTEGIALNSEVLRENVDVFVQGVEIRFEGCFRGRVFGEFRDGEW